MHDQEIPFCRDCYLQILRSAWQNARAKLGGTTIAPVSLEPLPDQAAQVTWRVTFELSAIVRLAAQRGDGITRCLNCGAPAAETVSA